MQTQEPEEIARIGSVAGPDKRPCVTIVSNNLSIGGALAPVSLARALRDAFSVQIIGSAFGEKLWPGLHDPDLRVDTFAGGRLPGYLRTISEMQRQMVGDVVIAHQLRLPSYGAAMLHRHRTGAPCVLYIDDDDLALTMPGRSKRLVNRLRNPNGDVPTRLMFRLRDRADRILCGSDYFSQRFGGTTVPLGRDARLYDPADQRRASLRRELGIRPDQTVVGFMGNPRPHVGIEDLVSALELLADENVLLLVAPPGRTNDFARGLFARSSARIRVLEDRPSTDIPGLLAASDLVVVPHRTDEVGRGQVPARLVEAMAMAKPVIATRGPEISSTLGDSAVLVDDRSPPDIAEAIRWITAHPEQAAAMGGNARRTFEREFTLDAVARKLVPVLEELLGSRTERKS